MVILKRGGGSCAHQWCASVSCVLCACQGEGGSHNLVCGMWWASFVDVSVKVCRVKAGSAWLWLFQARCAWVVMFGSVRACMFMWQQIKHVCCDRFKHQSI